jgi:hypothetical protein
VSQRRVSADLRRVVRDRAGNRCEYCRLPDAFAESPFHIDHVRPRQHRGPTNAENLAYCCGWCNLHKGTNLSAVDPHSGRAVRLFNPRVADGEHTSDGTVQRWSAVPLAAVPRPIYSSRMRSNCWSPEQP